MLQVVLLSVSQLREHWDETSSKVIGRRNELEQIKVNNREFEAKRRETESWLNRMESWQRRIIDGKESPANAEAFQVRNFKNFLVLVLILIYVSRAYTYARMSQP